jgi:transcriptional regulator with XRE-family HTH domain
MMTPEEALAARNTLGLTQDKLAADLGLTPNVIEAWEAGSVRIPKRFEDQLRFDAAAKERQDAVAASGLEECEIDKAWESETLPKDPKAMNAYLERGLKHRATCPRCIARDEFIKDRFGKMPPMPMSASMRAFGAVADTLEKWPRWTQPAGWGALLFGAYSLMRVVFMLPRLAKNPQYWRVAIGGLLASMAIGAVLGFAYGGYRAFRETRSAPSAS